MLRISKMTDYGTVVMTHLAKHPDRHSSARELAEELDIGMATVSKILKILERANLLSAQRGKNGGYRLVRSPDEVSVAEVIRAMEGPIALTECASDLVRCEQEDSCTVQSNWQRINRAILQALERVTLTDMNQSISEKGVASDTLTFYREPNKAAL